MSMTALLRCATASRPAPLGPRYQPRAGHLPLSVLHSVLAWRHMEYCTVPQIAHGRNVRERDTSWYSNTVTDHVCKVVSAVCVPLY